MAEQNLNPLHKLTMTEGLMERQIDRYRDKATYRGTSFRSIYPKILKSRSPEKFKFLGSFDCAAQVTNRKSEASAW